VDFSQNLIERVPLLPLSIQTLLLFDNKISVIANQERLPELRNVYLSGNQLTDLPRSFSGWITEYFLMGNGFVT
jgi:Leucine-rich repeat (LRR) protein